MNDWSGLAGLMYADIFSLDFLTPLDEVDTKFKLEVRFSTERCYIKLLMLINEVCFF